MKYILLAVTLLINHIIYSQTAFYGKSAISTKALYFIKDGYIYNGDGNFLGVVKDNKIFDLSGNQVMWYKTNTLYNLEGYVVAETNPQQFSLTPILEIPKLTLTGIPKLEPVYKPFYENTGIGLNKPFYNNTTIGSGITPIQYDNQPALILLQQSRIRQAEEEFEAQLKNEALMKFDEMSNKQIEKFTYTELSKWMDHELAATVQKIYMPKLTAYIRESQIKNIFDVQSYTFKLLDEVIIWNDALTKIKEQISNDVNQIATKYKNLNVNKFELKMESLDSAIYDITGRNKNGILMRQIKVFEKLNKASFNYPLSIWEKHGEDFINPSKIELNKIKNTITNKQGLNLYFYLYRSKNKNGIFVNHIDTLATWGNTIIYKDTLFGRKYNLTTNILSQTFLDSTFEEFRRKDASLILAFNYFLKNNYIKDSNISSSIYNSKIEGNLIDGISTKYTNPKDSNLYKTKCRAFLTSLLIDNEFSSISSEIFEIYKDSNIFHSPIEIQNSILQDPEALYKTIAKNKGNVFVNYFDFQQIVHLDANSKHLNNWKSPWFKNKTFIGSETIPYLGEE